MLPVGLEKTRKGCMHTEYSYLKFFLFVADSLEAWAGIPVGSREVETVGGMGGRYGKRWTRMKTKRGRRKTVRDGEMENRVALSVVTRVSDHVDVEESRDLMTACSTEWTKADRCR